MLLENTNNHCKSLPINHVGIIMDGNRRWAKSNGLKNIDGHKKGAKTAKAIITKAIDLNIKYLTLFAFSSENWKRKSEEINDLISLLRFFLKKEIKNLINAGIKLSTIGELSIFPKDIKKKLEESITLSKKNNSN